MDESALTFSDSQLDELTRVLLEDADVDGSGSISFEELQQELVKYPGVVKNLTIRLGCLNMLDMMYLKCTKLIFWCMWYTEITEITDYIYMYTHTHAHSHAHTHTHTHTPRTCIYV